jgi:hypothetical protein
MAGNGRGGGVTLELVITAVAGLIVGAVIVSVAGHYYLTAVVDTVTHAAKVDLGFSTNKELVDKVSQAPLDMSKFTVSPGLDWNKKSDTFSRAVTEDQAHH